MIRVGGAHWLAIRTIQNGGMGVNQSVVEYHRCKSSGFILSRINGAAGSEVAFVVSGILYTLMGHYFLTLLVITHHLWYLIHGDLL